MIIDIANQESQENIHRYESDIAPRAGEIIATFTYPVEPSKRFWIVRSVLHLIRFDFATDDYGLQQLITVYVDEISPN